MIEVIYTGLREATLYLLKANLHNISLVPIEEGNVRGNAQAIQQRGALLIGEDATNPVRVAQEAYAQDKCVSILIINDQKNHMKVKQALQFAPFIGPTIQAVSSGIGSGLAPILEDSLQRTEQRRSYAKLKSANSSIPVFTPNHMEKVRVNYMTRVLDEAPIGAILLGKEGNVLSVNSYFSRLFDLTDRQVLGIPLPAHFQEEIREDILDYITIGYHQKEKRVFELVRDGGRKYLEISVGDIDSGSQSDYRIAIINDVTDAMLAQQRTNAHLFELQRLNDDLKRANADLDTFVYTASHDLKSPILNIEGLLNLLDESLSNEQKASLPEIEHIRLSVERFKNTIEDLTEVARIQRNFTQEPVQLRIPDLVEDVLQLLSPEIEQAGATIELDCQAASTIVFSKKNMKSILLNLLSNAIKYRSPERPLRVLIRSTYEGNNFCLTVQDNGMGIPAGKQERVFQLFKRMHVHVKGSGVGLYIVKRIVENSGGWVMVSSEEEKGATFKIQLPVNQ